MAVLRVARQGEPLVSLCPVERHAMPGGVQSPELAAGLSVAHVGSGTEIRDGLIAVLAHAVPAIEIILCLGVGFRARSLRRWTSGRALRRGRLLFLLCSRV